MCPVWRQRGRTRRETCHVLYQSLTARLSYFSVKLVIIEVTILSCDGLVVITNEFAIIIEVTILSCDGLVTVITHEFAIIIEVTILSYDGLVAIAQPN